MIFVIMLLGSVVVSAVTAFLLIKSFQHMLKLTLNQMIVKDLQVAWLKYMQIALVIIGMSFGVNTRDIKQIIYQRDMQSISMDVFFSQIWQTLTDTALAIIIAIFILLFMYLIIYYINGLYKSDKE